jgi:putative toxin-antitoxin system antitoxin component (TIGR02293 family)
MDHFCLKAARHASPGRPQKITRRLYFDHAETESKKMTVVNTLSRNAAKGVAKRQPPAAARQRPAGTEQRLLRSVGGAGQRPKETLDDYVSGFRSAPPLARIEAERAGVSGSLLKDMAKSMGLSNTRMFEVIGVPKATAEKRAANNTAVTGTPGQAALGVVRLLGIAKAMAQNSDAPEARDFDTAKWLGEWIERPQPSLGGRKPAEVLDTPTGVETVVKLLGAIESGAYL